MPVPAAVPVELAASVRATLKKRARGHKTAHRDRQRAVIVLLAARGWPNTRIAGHLRISEDTVRTWRGRFAERGLPGLADLPRAGRPRRISELERAEVCALACQLPAEAGAPLARWSCPELAAELARLGLAGPMSDSSVRRILAEHPVKPWRFQSRGLPPRPGLRRQGSRRPRPLPGPLPGRAARPERPGPVRRRQAVHPGPRPLPPSAPPAPGQPMRVEHEYERMGALALPAGLDVRTGKVFASTPPTTGIAPFMALMDQIMCQEPYRSASRVFVIVDNGSDHRGKAAAKRLRDRHPNCIMIHTPMHASWLNQVEIFFSIIQRKVVSPNDFADTQQLADTLLAFIDRYNATATPFKWKYTAADLHRHLARLPTSAPAATARLPTSAPAATARQPLPEAA
jgi:transposase